MKIVFFGTSEIGVPILEQLVQTHEVIAVVTTIDKPVGRKQILTPSPIAQLAEQFKITIHKPKKIKNNPEFIEQAKNWGADIFIVVSYGKILPLELLNIPPLKTINVHFSLLPKYRGPAPVQFTLLNGETKTGSTIFILDELVDNGPILSQAELPISPTDTNISLQAKLSKLSTELLLTTLAKYQAGELKPKNQNHEQATFTKIIQKTDGKIDWNKNAQAIFNQWRAYQPWPRIFTTWQNQTLQIVECRPSDTHITAQAGTIVNNLITCGNNSTLELISVQLEGKNITPVQDFINGHPEFNGSTLK